MAKVTLVFAVLLIALGLIGFFGTGHTHYHRADSRLDRLVLALAAGSRSVR